MATGRLILSPRAAGDWNMAVDEALMVSAAGSGDTILRIYRWEEPTLSLGYFQSYEDRLQHRDSLDCPCVRRHSGGGAIVHDRELTYSLALSNGKAQGRSHTDVYFSVHQAIIEWIASVGVIATRYADSIDTASISGLDDMQNLQDRISHSRQFLCFQRRTDDDLVIGSHKVLGSAQRKKHNAFSQHGSLLLGKSVRAPQLPGITEISEPNVALDPGSNELAERLAHFIGSELQIDWTRSELTEEETAQSHAVLESKFSTRKWTQRR